MCRTKGKKFISYSPQWQTSGERKTNFYHLCMITSWDFGPDDSFLTTESESAASFLLHEKSFRAYLI